MQACRGRCLILYGSQTGQSKAVAEILAERCRRLGLETALFELDEFEEKAYFLFCNNI